MKIKVGEGVCPGGRGGHLRDIMSDHRAELFSETYRVVAAENQNLIIQGLRSGEVLTIVPETPLKAEQYPPGKLIELSDPLNRPEN